MPNGQTFGIPYVRVERGPSWHYVDVAALYTGNVAGTPGSVPAVNKQWGTDMLQDLGGSSYWGVLSQVGAAQAAMWSGESIVDTASQSDPFFLSSDSLGIYGRPMVIGGTMIADQTDHVTATTLVGISMGYNSASASATPIPASPSQPLIALYIECSGLTFNLLLAKGNSTAYEKLILTGVATPAIGNASVVGWKSNRLEIRYNPAGHVAEGWIDGWFGGRITTAAVFPVPTYVAGKKMGFNHFGTSGSDAGGFMGSILMDHGYWVGMP